jgi:hypothetical protein
MGVENRVFLPKGKFFLFYMKVVAIIFEHEIWNWNLM